MSQSPGDPAQLKVALQAAETMRAADVDPAGVAHCLLYLHARSVDLEQLLRVVDRYLRFGMPDHELSEMRVLVERLREQASGGEGDSTLPL